MGDLVATIDSEVKETKTSEKNENKKMTVKSIFIEWAVKENYSEEPVDFGNRKVEALEFFELLAYLMEKSAGEKRKAIIFFKSLLEVDKNTVVDFFVIVCIMIREMEIDYKNYQNDVVDMLG